MKFATINPATNKLEKEFEFDTREQIEEKLNKAHAAYDSWRKLTIQERGDKLAKVAELMEERAEEFAIALNTEMGKPMPEAQFEVKDTYLGMKGYIKQAEEALKPAVVDMGYKKAMTVYQPIGVIYSIMPWNFPVTIPMFSNMQSMLAGNTILYKPAPSTPQIGELYRKLFIDAGLGNGEFGVTYASIDDTEFIIAHSHVRGVNFTGSTAAGKIVASLCGKHMKKCQFELGGSDPCIILDDADLDKAVEIIVTTRLINAGQVCISPKRIIVQQEVYDDFKAKLIAKVKAKIDTTSIGPIARADLHEGLKK